MPSDRIRQDDPEGKGNVILRYSEAGVVHRLDDVVEQICLLSNRREKWNKPDLT